MSRNLKRVMVPADGDKRWRALSDRPGPYASPPLNTQEATGGTGTTPPPTVAAPSTKATRGTGTTPVPSKASPATKAAQRARAEASSGSSVALAPVRSAPVAQPTQRILGNDGEESNREDGEEVNRSPFDDDEEARPRNLEYKGPTVFQQCFFKDTHFVL